MPDNSYTVAVGFYVHAYIYKTVEAPNDAAAIEAAKAAAADVMNSREYPDHIDVEEKYEGVIGYVDRIDDDGERREVAGDISFGADVPTPERARALSALKGARLMLYAWRGARRNMGLPDDHAELNDTIAEIESMIALGGANGH